ncbi:hypothetical protein C2869_00555 [Saccharobesus litoralis]|uniref:YaeQ family protein n=1 Tax=Saccharobesus litoralis TaxID=2172099 RepID=A0A2S0VLD9_9ALTE|nr:YaeQ family protein [Saccharobesus litoralis]AWB65022.1 hypothetical protein C2869_00555 [Saccharobesus litoralis]
MALKSTIFKVQLDIADTDRHYYQSHKLTVAQHPSETDQRLMVRLLAFAINANDQLNFNQELCSNDDEAELWQVELNGQIKHWIAFGQPEEKQLKKACRMAERVTLYCYGGNAVTPWWQQIANKLNSYTNLAVFEFAEQQMIELSQLVNKNMQLQITIDSGEIWISSDIGSVHITPNTLQENG